MVSRSALRAFLVGVLGSGLVVVAPVAAGAAPPACAASQASAATAAAMARQCGRAVEDMSKRTEWSKVEHNADGTQVLTEYVQPRWARSADGTWADVDTALHLAGGRVVPAHTVLPVSFSAGGDGALANLDDGAYGVGLTWPAMLPAPILSGDTATYPNVFPDVDLRLTANATGFAEVLVVKTPAAARNKALAHVPFGLITKGVTAAGQANGETQARNAKGGVVFTSPTPMMWDSSGDQAGAGSAAPSAAGAGAAGAGAGRLMPRMAVMASRVEASRLTITPDPAMLADPGVTFPLLIDPSWNGVIVGNMWKNVASRSDVVNSTSFTLLNGSTKGDAGSGRICDMDSGGNCISAQYIVRSMFWMDTSGVVGKHVLSATFNITQKWSFTCNSGGSNAKLWITPAISSGTTWNNQGTWDGSHTAEAPGNRRIDSAFSCAGAGNDAFDATAMVQLGLSQGWPGITLGLAAVDEGTMNQWKRFDSTTAGLAITYNSYPNVPDTFSTGGQSGCVTGSSRPVVAVNNPVLSARVTDPDGAAEGDIGGFLYGSFQWQVSSGGTWVAEGSGQGTPQANGTTSPGPGPTFTAGVHRWHVRAEDFWSLSGVGSGTDVSAYGPWCEFEVVLNVPHVPVITPDPGNQPFVSGKTVRLTISPGGTPADTDITGYNWFVVDGAGTHATTFTSGSVITLDWTPIAGQGTIHVKAKNNAQFGNEQTYSFNAAQSSTETARWPLDEPAGATVASDITGNGHDATVTIGGFTTFGAPGPIINGFTVLSFDADPGDPSAADPAGLVVDTSKSFTVSALAAYNPTPATAVVAGQSRFTLEHTAGTGEDRWEFVGYDGSGTVIGRARSTAAPVPGVFDLLTAVYDSGTATMTLYVNGAAQGTATNVHLGTDSSAFQIGHHGTGGGLFSGGVGDVRVWDRALSVTEVAAMADPTDPANVSIDNVGQWLVEPESCLGDPVVTCLDSSGYAHDINLTGDMTTTSAGQVGSGLLDGGTDGEAITIDPNSGWEGPALRTDQSFTISAWVKLADMPTHNYTVLAQNGYLVSGFFLGARLDGSGVPHWSLAMKDDDSASSGWASATASAAITSGSVGAWVHLIGVYDASAQRLTLYVNGAQAASGSRAAAPWMSWGGFTIAAALWTPVGGETELADVVHGTIDTVYAYAGAVPAAAIAANRIP